MTAHVTVSKEGGVLTLAFNRAEKKNAITDAMYKVLADQLEAAETDPAVRVVLFRGEGEMFSSGNDVLEFAQAASGGAGLAGNVVRFVLALGAATKPLVAAVQGKAVGVGTTMLLHCDYVILAEDAQLLTPFIGLALVPEAASTLLLPARIGHARAFGMFALGEPAKASDALAWGLANKVVPLEGLQAAGEAAARRLAAQPLGAVVATKKLMRDGAAIAAQMQAENAEFSARLKSAEAREAFAAFAERRPPDFSRFS